MNFQRPDGVGTFEFVVLATLRAGQLMRGCVPRVEGIHKATTLAQVEVATGKVRRLDGVVNALASATGTPGANGAPGVITPATPLPLSTV